MSLIESYMFRRIGLVAFAALTITTGIALTTQVLLRVDLLASTGQTIGTVGKLALYLTPGMVAVALPFAVLIGILQTMRTMNQDSELIVLEASGSGILKRSRPAIMIGIIGTLIAFVLNIWVEPYTSQKIRELLTRASGDLLSTAIQSGQFKQVEQGLFIQIAEKLPNGTFGGIFVSDKRDESNHFVYIGKTGSILNEDGRTLLLVNDGQIQRKSVADNSMTFIKFDNYSLDAGTFSAPGGIALRGKDRPTSYLMNPDVNDAEYQRFPERLSRELHRRFSDPLYVLALAIVAIFVTVTAQSHRKGATLALTLTAAAGFGLRAIGFVIVSNGGFSLASTSLMYMFPLGIILVYGWLLFSGRRMRWFDNLTQKLPGIFASLIGRFSKRGQLQ